MPVQGRGPLGVACPSFITQKDAKGPEGLTVQPGNWACWPTPQGREGRSLRGHPA